MYDDPFPAAGKILTDIDVIFKRDKNLTDFEILPVPVGENKSPVIHAENSLGLEKWCVRHLYLHVYHKLMDLKQQQRLRREDPNIVSRLLLGGVLLNPDNALLWNMRREFVVMGRFDFSAELHIVAVTLSRRPKCSEAFIYRRWLLGRLLAKSTQVGALFYSDILREELRVTQMAADRYANNYHAWNHRMWVVTHIAPQLPNFVSVFIDEWTASEAWVSKHVSEHSGVQYRQFLLKQLVIHLKHSDLCVKLHQACCNVFLPPMNSDGLSLSNKPPKESSQSENLRQHLSGIIENKYLSSKCPLLCDNSVHILQTALLAYDLMLITELIRLYPGHEALWSHRRFVAYSFCSLAKEISSHTIEVQDGVPVPKAQKLSASEGSVDDNFLWRMVTWHEDKLRLECTSIAEEDCFQSKLAARYQKWFQQILLPRNRVYNCGSVGF